jgi:ribonuclease HI
MDTWLNWQSYIFEEDSHQEAFTVGSAWEIGLCPVGRAVSWYVPLQLVIQHRGGEQDTTNQRMELLAIRNALEYARLNRHPNERVIIYSDSAYAINCYKQQWYNKWQINGWVNSKGEDVANQDLWIQIIPYFENFWYSFSKVKGHSDNYWNNECDRFAQEVAQDLKDSFRGLNNER